MTLKLCYACDSLHPTGQRCPNQRPWGGPATQANKRRLLVRDHYQCQECGTDVVFETAQLDHIQPRAIGGTDTDSNLRITCIPCNQRKGNT